MCWPGQAGGVGVGSQQSRAGPPQALPSQAPTKATNPGRRCSTCCSCCCCCPLALRSAQVLLPQDPTAASLPSTPLPRFPPAGPYICRALTDQYIAPAHAAPHPPPQGTARSPRRCPPPPAAARSPLPFPPTQPRRLTAEPVVTAFDHGQLLQGDVLEADGAGHVPSLRPTGAAPQAAALGARGRARRRPLALPRTGFAWCRSSAVGDEALMTVGGVHAAAEGQQRGDLGLPLRPADCHLVQWAGASARPCFPPPGASPTQGARACHTWELQQVVEFVYQLGST